MRQLQAENQPWTLVIDTDELVLQNQNTVRAARITIILLG